MSEISTTESVRGLLIATAEAHHEATGGAGSRWAFWYAEHMVDDLNRHLEASLDIDELERWLIAADERYQSESPAGSWPGAYAGWLLEDYTGD